jgi:hypothetical protein
MVYLWPMGAAVATQERKMLLLLLLLLGLAALQAAEGSTNKEVPVGSHGLAVLSSRRATRIWLSDLPTIVRSPSCCK